MMRMNPVISVLAAALLALPASGAFAADATAQNITVPGPKAGAKPEAPAAAKPADKNAEAASVNGHKIPVGDLDTILEIKRVQRGGMADPSDSRRKALDQMVDLLVLSAEAEKQGYDTPDFEKNVQQQKDQVDQMVAKYKEQMELLYKVQKKWQLAMAMINKAVEGVKAEPGEAKAYYDANKSQFETGGQVRASHIQVDTQEEAEKIKERLNKGEDFAALAKEKSKCPTASKGGDLGYFGQSGDMDANIAKAAFVMKVGDISDPVKTDVGYHILKLTERKEPTLKPFDEVKAEIEQKVTADKQKKVVDKMTETLKAKADIKINEELFKDKPAPAPATGNAPAATPVTPTKQD